MNTIVGCWTGSLNVTVGFALVATPVAPSVGVVAETVGGVLSTTTETEAEVVVFPAASRATAVIAYVPLGI